MPDRILVCVAWPYANYLLHVGQAAGAYLPADIFARYQRLAGNEVAMVSGSDCHGTPITVAADKEGVEPRVIVERYHAKILEVWERLGSLKEPERIRPWLYSVARNAALDAAQAGKRRRAASLEPMADRLDDHRSGGPTSAALGDELRATLLRAVESLPAIYREPFVLRHLEDWSYAEIGEMLGLPIETVETRLVRARRLLREMLQGKVEP